MLKAFILWLINIKHVFFFFDLLLIANSEQKRLSYLKDFNRRFKLFSAFANVACGIF
jgi:hypothetical protein